jgi:hypothetical protein
MNLKETRNPFEGTGGHPSVHLGPVSLRSPGVKSRRRDADDESNNSEYDDREDGERDADDESNNNEYDDREDGERDSEEEMADLKRTRRV